MGEITAGQLLDSGRYHTVVQCLIQAHFNMCPVRNWELEQRPCGLWMTARSQSSRPLWFLGTLSALVMVLLARPRHSTWRSTEILVGSFLNVFSPQTFPVKETLDTSSCSACWLPPDQSLLFTEHELFTWVHQWTDTCEDLMMTCCGPGAASWVHSWLCQRAHEAQAAQRWLTEPLDIVKDTVSLRKRHGWKRSSDFVSLYIYFPLKHQISF